MAHLLETLSVKQQWVLLEILLGFVTAQRESLPRACLDKRLGKGPETHQSLTSPFSNLSRVILKEVSKEPSAAFLLSHIGHRAWELQLVLTLLLSIRVANNSTAAGQLSEGNREEVNSAPCGLRDGKETFATLRLVFLPC